MSELKKIIFKSEAEMPSSPVSRAGTLANLTGSWRYLRPRYEEKLSPCIAACPAGERVEAWLRLLEDERYAEAWHLIKSVNPFPRVCGRVCFHPCETECNRGQYDRPIAIHALERFVADRARADDKGRPPSARKTGKSVGIVGSGPAGLTCAYHLARRGHSVTVYEAEAELGGMLRYGIPAYRLPKAVLDEEIEDIIMLGIDVHTNTRVEDIESLRRRHAAFFVATGFGESNRLQIPGEEGEGVLTALEFLRNTNSGCSVEPMGRVVVIGGGNAAIDAARTALRLGGHPTVLYRRSRAEMPAYAPEVEEAEREGVSVHFLTQPVEIVRESGRVVLVECVLNRLGEPDATGRKQPIAIPGSSSLIEADTVIIAAGERPGEYPLQIGSIPDSKAEESGQSKHGKFRNGIFVGGDLTEPRRTVAHAIGSGRRAAMQIDKFLGGSGEDPASYLDGDVVRFESLNLDYFPHKPRVRLPMLPLREREKNFGEIGLGISPQSAAEEADRCFHCGVCVACDNCSVFCPDIVVRKSSDGTYSIDYDYCKGCGICVHECPRNAMSIDEEIRT
ncbi:MAG: FAD-binding protein [Candidatus Abyssobacteria bacterium SURF_17]|jgi:2-oxoacid:acceptor oxidoreductase delta subunit (pyruvate/2-ketoisovalerate family)|uniref:FAD-binding protein n=1 Tax=Candidatus Abyssobacteria bacterium SURF_17 TaxID=2093361 RepID=A0A419F0T6_9BACT|nr:MAG: FAD-binding protein [Candidatus Abyssubacteria bacterium SURF_17]